MIPSLVRIVFCLALSKACADELAENSVSLSTSRHEEAGLPGDSGEVILAYGSIPGETGEDGDERVIEAFLSRAIAGVHSWMWHYPKEPGQVGLSITCHWLDLFTFINALPMASLGIPLPGGSLRKEAMRDRICPLTFEPVFRDYLWGGRNLETRFGRKLPPGIVAESWDISGHPDSPTRVEEGYWKGRTLPDVLKELGADLVGTRCAETLSRHRFPLLIKLLDANADLSVQVHPDDEYACIHEVGELGKTEMWYVLYASPGCQLIYGLARGVTRESMRSAIENGALETQLYRLPIKSGDCIFIPSGTVHALLAGAVVAEIQQNSDTTYRLYDWGRVGADGKPRPLHVEKALDVIDWDIVEPARVDPLLLSDEGGVRRSLLVDCPQFTVELIELAENAQFIGRCDGATFEIWGCVEGAGEVRWQGEPVSAEAIRFVLLPAVLGEYTVRARKRSTLLRVFVSEQARMP